MVPVEEEVEERVLEIIDDTKEYSEYDDVKSGTHTEYFPLVIYSPDGDVLTDDNSR